MKKVFKLSVIILLFFSSISSSQEHQLVIGLKDGTSNKLSISTIKSIGFNTSMLNIDRFDGTNAVYTKNDISIIQFEFSTGIKEPSINKNFYAYPNPTTGIVFFNGLTDEMSNLRVFNMSGVQVFSAQINESVKSLNVSFLPKGIYLLTLNNEQIKLIKL